MAILQRRWGCLRALADAGAVVMLLLLQLPSPALSLVVNATIFKGCSRNCESRHCQDPIRLRYGKYCGIGYTGCEGEVPCDGIDSCCKSHDICIGANLENYVNRTCNDELKRCAEKFRDANMTQFNGSTCSAIEIEEVIITSMNIATLGRSTGSPLLSPGKKRNTALVFILLVVFLLGSL